MNRLWICAFALSTPMASNALGAVELVSQTRSITVTQSGTETASAPGYGIWTANLQRQGSSGGFPGSVSVSQDSNIQPEYFYFGGAVGAQRSAFAQSLFTVVFNVVDPLEIMNLSASVVLSFPTNNSSMRFSLAGPVGFGPITLGYGPSTYSFSSALPVGAYTLTINLQIGTPSSGSGFNSGVVRVNFIPAPSAMGVLALSGAMATRRRRGR